MESEELDFKDILKHIDRESEHFVVRLETHHSGRLVTVVQPHSLTKDDAALFQLAHKLKGAIGTGGDIENGRILLHGDVREKVKGELSKLGFQDENIELI